MRSTRRSAVLVFVAAIGLAVASEPGQPLDCSDMVILQPGLTCVYWRAPGDPACGDNRTPGCIPYTLLASDNLGNDLWQERLYLGVKHCSGSYLDAWRTEFKSYDGVTERVLAYFEDRCGVGDTIDLIHGGSYGNFSATAGRLEFRAASSCGYGGPGTCGYSESSRMMALTGFATLMDVLQTYTPQSAQISFRVPYMPEGMRGADRFDTYWGDLASVGDWSQAHGLQCGYPAAPPSVGDYLTVTDTLPTPSPDHGYYYVTAATYQGQTRYGRKTSGGRLNGRDPAVLPACAQP